MLDNAKFIWLNSEVYPDLQKSPKYITVYNSLSWKRKALLELPDG